MSYAIARISAGGYPPGVPPTSHRPTAAGIALGKNIQRALKNAGFTSQTELAAASHLTVQQVSDLIRGRYGNVELDTLFRLSTALRCSIDALVRGMRSEYDDVQVSLGSLEQPTRDLLETWEKLSGEDQARLRALIERVAELSTPPQLFRHGAYIGPERRRAS